MAETPEEAVRVLKESYQAYMAAMQRVLALGDDAVEQLIASLDKRAIPIVETLGHLLTTPSAPKADAAIPPLLYLASSS